MKKSFQVVSDYSPAGDQPQAIESLIKGIRNGLAHQTLLALPVQVKPLPLLM